MDFTTRLRVFKLLKHVLSLALVTAMTSACISGGSSNSENASQSVTSQSVTLTGSVGDGPIKYAQLLVRDSQGVVIAQTESDANANYSVELPSNVSYPLIVSVSGGTDVVTNRPPDFELVSVALDSSASTVNVNPFSTLILQTAERYSGGVNAGNVARAQQVVLSQLGFGFDSKLVPDTIGSAIDKDNIAMIVKANEALGEAIRRTKQALGSELDHNAIISTLASDLTDDVLDGRGPDADSRVAATMTVITAQVLTEALSNKLYVDGYDATSRMDQAINVSLPEATTTTADVAITDEILKQARIVLAAAIALDSSPEIISIKESVDSLQAGMRAEDVYAALPAGRDTVLSSQVLKLSGASNDALDAVNSVVKSAQTTIAQTTIQQGSSGSGLLVVEAENYYETVEQGGHQWARVSREGHSGDGAVEATPNTSTVNNDNYLTESPRLDYLVDFVQTGTHYVWVRGYAPTGGDNSLHVGLDGNQVSTSEKVEFATPGPNWAWSNRNVGNNVLMIDVASPGTRTLNVWMREDGITVDKLVLTTDPNYAPEGASLGAGSGATSGGSGSTNAGDGSNGSGSGSGDTGSGGTGGTGGNSNPGGESNSAPDTAAPTVPTGLTAGALSATQVSLSWQSATDDKGVDGYKVYRDNALIGVTSGTSYVDTGLAAQTRYVYRASAFDAAGNTSGQSGTASVTTTQANLPGGSLAAFPGAEGFGAKAVGGRGGAIYEVTNLNDSGPGSLRAAVEASGPRTVIFRIGGTITLKRRISITNPYITVAGQTAPGGGITIKGGRDQNDALIKIYTHDVIIRYIRFRHGPSYPTGQFADNISIGAPDPHETYNVIIDHCSLSWSVDENIDSWYNTHDISVQWSIISEGLHKSTHTSGKHSKGTAFGNSSRQLSFHHNLLAHNVDRNPLVYGRERFDVINNIAYHWGPFGMQILAENFPMKINVIGNYMIPGVGTDVGRYAIAAGNYESTGQERIYVADNITPQRPNDSDPEWDVMGFMSLDFNTGETAPGWLRIQAPAEWQRSSPWPSSAVPVTVHPVMQAYDLVLEHAGVTVPERDTVDQRIISDVRNGTGTFINDPSDVGGWPVLASGTAPADRDRDGMPDSWETAKGLDPDKAADRNGIAPSGYTWVEEYLDSLVSGTP